MVRNVGNRNEYLDMKRRKNVKDECQIGQASEIVENSTKDDLTNTVITDQTVVFNVHDEKENSFVTSTPLKRKFRCDECNDESQCVECFVMQNTSTHEMSPKRHRVHFSDDNC